MENSVSHHGAKGAAVGNVSSYRPISVLPTVSKILEKVIHLQLREHIDCNNLLSNLQHGFIDRTDLVNLHSSLINRLVKFRDDRLYIAAAANNVARILR